jgi:class 3 adenylate cyclase
VTLFTRINEFCCFARCQLPVLSGQFPSFLGDGCLAVFADPESAVVFARDVRASVLALGLDTRSAIHVGRVHFDIGGPYGRAIGVSFKLMRRGVAGKIMLSEAAAGVLRAGDDLMLGTIN